MDTSFQEGKEEIEIDIREICFVLLHKLWIIIVAGIFMAIVFGYINKYMKTPLYQSTTKIYVIHRQDVGKTTYADLQTGIQLTQDYQILVRSRPVMEKVIENLTLHMSPGALAGMIYVNNPEGTRIIEISAVSSDAGMAKRIADEVAVISSEQMVNIMAIEKANIVEYGELPAVPTSPNVRKGILYGGILGILLASLIIVAVHMLNDNIRTPEDVEKYLHATILGILPVETEVGAMRKRRHKEIDYEISRMKENWNVTN